ncbi:CRIB domain-containing protein RIC7-like [Zingiber officinale]|uniref:CRIB domain-containing protein RIC7-like n=1 Tax=Zingiber officinale TaxID=94328 RepID=UPI001C4AA142|nr:CRIB domain-containing protein RIC7-like [Zingiber officinale]
MGTGMKMKNLFKGLRYLSQIFVPEEEEEEMQIGHPTDVKHVAHIGCDGQSINNSPSWMTEFRSTATSSAAAAAAQSNSVSGSFLLFYRTQTVRAMSSPYLTSLSPADPHSIEAPPQERSPGGNGGSDRKPRRPQRNVGADIRSRDATSGEGAKPERKHRTATASAAESAEDAAVVPRNPQRRKPKGAPSSSSSSVSQNGGSTRSKAARCAESRSDAAKAAIEEGEGEGGEEQ